MQRIRRACLEVGLLVAALAATGCVTTAEFRKVERRVIDLERGQGSSADRGRVADIGSQMESLQQQIAALQGRLEVTEHRVEEALEHRDQRDGRRMDDRRAGSPRLTGHAIPRPDRKNP